MKCQNSYLDDKIVEDIQNGHFLVDTESGSIKGRVNRDGGRKEIGKVNKGRRNKSTTIYFDGYNRSVDIARIIWLAANGHVPPTMRVDLILKNGDYSIKNLKLVKNNEYLGYWTDDEIEILKNGLVCKSWSEISRETGRSEKSCHQKARSLKMGMPAKKRAWVEQDENMLKTLFEEGKSIVEIAKEMGRTFTSIKLHIRKYGKIVKNNKAYLRDLNHKNFYASLKSAKSSGSAILSCCLCKDKVDYKHCVLHHIDGDHKNNNISNIATICPNCHSEVHAGEHQGEILYSIWKRVYSDGTTSGVETNIDDA